MKRFKYIAFDGFEDNGEFITPHQVVDLLNKYYEENIELKSKSKMIYERDAYKKLYEDLKEENEQLKSENNMLKVTIGRNEEYIKRLTETSEWHC